MAWLSGTCYRDIAEPAAEVRASKTTARIQPIFTVPHNNVNAYGRYTFINIIRGYNKAASIIIDNPKYKHNILSENKYKKNI